MATNIRKVIPCKCGLQNTFNFETELDVEDVSITGKCPSCGSVVHVSISALLKPAPLQMPSTPSVLQANEPATPPAQGLEAVNEEEEKAHVEDALNGMFRS